MAKNKITIGAEIVAKRPGVYTAMMVYQGKGYDLGVIGVTREKAIASGIALVKKLGAEEVSKRLFANNPKKV